jgi:hypothetical protein
MASARAKSLGEADRCKYQPGDLVTPAFASGKANVHAAARAMQNVTSNLPQKADLLTEAAISSCLLIMPSNFPVDPALAGPPKRSFRNAHPGVANFLFAARPKSKRKP